MKKTITIFLLISLTSTLYSQEYLTVDFTANTQLDSIYIKNTNQNESITISGDDILHLIIENSFVNETQVKEKQITMFPNPSEQISYIQFRNNKPNNSHLKIIDITGQLVFKEDFFLEKGEHLFSLTGLISGTYIISLQIGEKLLTEKLLISQNTNDIIALEKTNFSTNYENITSLNNKGTSIIKSLPYNIGEQLQIIGYANGYYESTIYCSPTENITIDLLLEIDNFDCGSIFIDNRDGNEYTTIQIGNQCWFAENLKYLPSVTYTLGVEPKYYVYDYYGTNLSEALESPMYDTFGALYNYYAADSACPKGWHLPTDDEWKTLEIYLGMSIEESNSEGDRGTNQGSKLASDANLWNDGALKENNDFGTSGFNAIPGGWFEVSDGMFFDISGRSWFWTSTMDQENNFWVAIRHIDNSSPKVIRFFITKRYGMSVRCIKH